MQMDEIPILKNIFASFRRFVQLQLARFLLVWYVVTDEHYINESKISISTQSTEYAMHFEAKPLRIVMEKENSFKKCDKWRDNRTKVFILLV